MRAVDHGLPAAHMSGLSNTHSIQRLRYQLAKGISPYLVIDAGRRRDASITNDHVYGLLGLLNKPVRNQITVHPGMETRTLFIQLAKSIIEYDQRLDLLKFVPSEQSFNNLPSWCPNFSSKNPLTPLAIGRYGIKVTRSATSGSALRVLDDVLAVEGIIIDKVTKAVEKYPSYDGTAWKDFLIWERTCRNLSEEAFSYSPSTSEIHGEALCAGYVSTGRRFSLQDLQSYDAMRAISDSNDPKSGPGVIFSKHWDYIGSVLAATSGRRFIVTRQGRIGLGPPNTRIGDLVCLLFDAETPFIFRARNDTGSFKVLGDAYLQGLMHGEEEINGSGTERIFLLA